MWDFFANHVWTILGVIGGLGGTVVVVLLVVGTITAGALLASIVGFLKAVIEFFKTPLGQAIGIVILCALCAFVADIHRTRKDAAAWVIKENAINAAWREKIRVAAEQFAAARNDRDVEVDGDIKQLVDASLGELKALNEQLQQQKATTDAKPQKADPNCTLGPDDLDDSGGVRPDKAGKPVAPAGTKPARKSLFDRLRHGG